MSLDAGQAFKNMKIYISTWGKAVWVFIKQISKVLGLYKSLKLFYFK